MTPSPPYRTGIRIVLTVVVASGFLVTATTRSGPNLPRAAQELGDQAQPLDPLRLTERSGRTVTEADLADRVAIVAFIFTRCQLSCPRISGVMKSLQERLAGTSVLLVSLSVDPEHDTPKVLADYARSYDADPDRWWFLTGQKAPIYELISTKFKLSLAENPNPDKDGRTETIAHSDRLALVDRGMILGLFDSNDATELDGLVGRARRLAIPAWVRALPPVNASLNALCTIFLILGWILIRRRSWESHTPLLSRRAVRGHVSCMVIALLASAAFLTCYLVYHYHAGSMPFRGQGPIRLLYLTVLLSHTLLATFALVPLVLLTLFRAWRQDFPRHRSIASVTFPIWVYVSTTGVLIYGMLYHLPVA